MRASYKYAAAIVESCRSTEKKKTLLDLILNLSARPFDNHALQYATKTKGIRRNSVHFQSMFDSFTEKLLIPNLQICRYNSPKISAVEGLKDQ